MDRHIIQVYHQGKEEEVCIQTSEDPTMSGPKLLLLRFARDRIVPRERQPVVIQSPSPFPYKSYKEVPWKYGINVLKNDSSERHDNSATNIDKIVVDNIFGIRGMTRSGRLCTPTELRNGKGHEKVVEEAIMEKAKTFLKGKASQIDQDPEGKHNKEISDEVDCKFLWFIPQSKYKVVDKLNRMSARISLLDLLMHSTSHRKLLIKILNGPHVERDISLDQLEGIVGHIRANDYLTFTEDEIPTKERGYNKVLYIFAKCMDYILAIVLIDNGSSLNVMPKATLDKISCEEAYLHPSRMIVRAFDGSRREVTSEIELPIQVGPCTFQVMSQVMNIFPAYSCLLGHPWIHSNGVVPSTLLQKLKFIVNDKLIIVSGEEDLLVSGPLHTPYIETAKEALETSFQALKIVETMYVEPFKVNLYLSRASVMMVKFILKEGYNYRHALRKNAQGLLHLLELTENKGRHGLGYKPIWKKKMIKGRKEKNMARLKGYELKKGGIALCDIGQTF